MIFFLYYQILISVIKRNVSQILFMGFETTLNFPNFKCFQISKLHQVIKRGSKSPSKSNCRKLFQPPYSIKTLNQQLGGWFSASEPCLMNHVEWVSVLIFPVLCKLHRHAFLCGVTSAWILMVSACEMKQNKCIWLPCSGELYFTNIKIH